MARSCGEKYMYVSGCRVRTSRVAVEVPGHGLLRVVSGPARPGDGQIHVSELMQYGPVQAFVEVPGGSPMRLQLDPVRATGPGRHDFDPSAVPAAERDSYVLTALTCSSYGRVRQHQKDVVRSAARVGDKVWEHPLADEVCTWLARGGPGSVQAQYASALGRPLLADGAVDRRDVAALRLCASEGWGVPEPIRIASGTSLYRTGDRVVRVAKPARSAMTAERLVATADLLDRNGVPVPLPLETPHRTPEGDEVTVWEYVATDASQAFPARDVGQILTRVHAIPLAEAAEALYGEPPALAAAAARGRGRVEELARDPKGFDIDADTITSMFNDLEQAFVSVCESEPAVLLHGDMNDGNVLWGAGPTRVCDLEACTQGPWVWDLVNTKLSVARGELDPSVLDDLVAGYGKAPESSPAWAPLCRLRALNTVTFRVMEAAAGSEAGAGAEELVAWMNAGFPGLPEMG